MNVKVCWVLVALQTLFVVLFAAFGRYGDEYDATKYPLFQDIHVMIFVGFGFLMSFLRRYGFSALGFTLLLASCIIQWALLCQGLPRLDDDYKIQMNIVSMYEAEIAACAILISTGAVLGRVSLMQLISMSVIETIVYCINLHLGCEILKAIDVGGSIFVHVFGAYFGLSVSIVIERASDTDISNDNSLKASNYSSDLFAMIGEYGKKKTSFPKHGSQAKGSCSCKMIDTKASIIDICVFCIARCPQLLISALRHTEIIFLLNGTFYIYIVLNLNSSHFSYFDNIKFHMLMVNFFESESLVAVQLIMF
nr:unnamed protein product [Callosobruchus chinensis]